MSAPVAINMRRDCFKCGLSIYLNPDVRKKDNPAAFEPLDTIFDPNTATEPPKFHYLTCKGKPPITTTTAPSPATEGGRTPYNYQEERQVYPDERPEFVARQRQEEKIKMTTKEATIGGIATSEFKQLIEDVAYMKGLLEAVIKAFDSALKTKPSNTPPILFTTASNMTPTIRKEGDEDKQNQAIEEEEERERQREQEQEQEPEEQEEPEPEQEQEKKREDEYSY